MNLWKAIKDRISGWWGIIIIVAMSVYKLLLGAVFFFLSALFLLVIFNYGVERYISCLLGLDKKSDILKFLGISMGGILLFVQAVASYKRAKAMEDAAKEQANAVLKTEQGQRQERLKNAIEHLGHSSDSVRLGGAYELLHLAKDTEELGQTVLDILCAHVRRTTGEVGYRKAHKSKPSEEVQSLLTLLFVQDHAIFKVLHVNLQGSWLNGANLGRARLQGARLYAAKLQGASLEDAQLQGADISGAQLQRASLEDAQLQGADISGAQLQRARLYAAKLQRADLSGAQLQRARLKDAQLQRADLFKAQLQGANLFEAKLQEAWLKDAQLQGADLSGARLQGADLNNAQLQGANLFIARLQGARLNDAQLQGASLEGAQLQGADLNKAQLQGAESSSCLPLKPFEDRIRKLIGRDSDLHKVVFSGGLSQEDVDSLVQDLSDCKAAELKKKLDINKRKSYELPQDSNAITGFYSEEEADKWIADYKEAMSKVPGVGDS